MDISSVFAAMQQHEQLVTMPFLDVMAFLRCASLLKDDILQPQPHTVSDTVDVLWDILKDFVWMIPTAGEAAEEEEEEEEEETFRLYGHKRGITPADNPQFSALYDSKRRTRKPVAIAIANPTSNENSTPSASTPLSTAANNTFYPPQPPFFHKCKDLSPFLIQTTYIMLAPRLYSQELLLSYLYTTTAIAV
ncbi:hypothetical protein EDD22DRAFT_959108 [Suillus occidentalis]|nr:hypothetical protein EDD22DRAFT_959108 [Suillus occidentalis]